MPVLSLPSLPGPICSNPNPARTWIQTPRCPPRRLSTKLTATLNNNPYSSAGDFLRQLSVSSVVLIGLGLSSLWAFPPPASARICPASPSSLAHAQETLVGWLYFVLHCLCLSCCGEFKHFWASISAYCLRKEESEILSNTDNGGEFENLENIEDEDMKGAFERWKSKTYALTVPLRIVALKEFLKSQGKRVRFHPEFRRSLRDIFHELSNPFNKGKINRKSAVAADLVTLGDSWLNFAIGKGLIEPMTRAEDQDWFQDLSDKWKVYLRRSSEGNLDSQGRIWAVPYRWGSMVIAYNRKEFQKHKLAPLQDWSDLWRPELAGKISMVDSPREIVGAVLKCMGASYNTTNIDSQVVGGKYAVLHQLELLVQQVRLFDSQHYLKAFRAGDVWVAVGWSSDVLPVAKTMSNVSVIVPKSGASLWADFWAVPSASRLVTDQIGGRVRGPSPLVEQWVEFCLQPERALPFKEEIIAGASPISLKSTVEGPQERRNGRPELDTNLISNIPPAEILSRCELLEPLSEDTLSDYQWLIQSLPKPHHSIMNRLTRSISSTFPAFWSKLQSRAA
ncbi:UNVERIFIED_CONTAM: Spermidine/putrescine-binding periplasmic protein 1 [Sesamum calycinum]|uniref:Spermidine/putrescine-binding periplasmic protein 1 n=1 Tax=Sesamum calycinum TaxID=2727403 RepID=A0AAW2QW71_9LAMI